MSLKAEELAAGALGLFPKGAGAKPKVRQRGLSPLVGKHLRNWYRSFCRPFYMQSHRRYSSTEERDDERATARGETKQSLKLHS